MFDNLTNRLTETIKKIKGQGRLTEENIQATLREVRRSLLESDVALEVIESFIKSIKEKSIGLKVDSHLNPSQELIKIIHESLISILGSANESINLKAKPPVVILLAGLQGCGKTTTAAKLAKYLSNTRSKRIMLSTTDIYRPAAIDQLETLAKQINIDCYLPEKGDKVSEIATKALENARKSVMDILILDTAGRLHIDKNMMAEIQSVHKTVSPIETLFVVDSMMGQDAAHTAKAFHTSLPLTGIILTKTDGDARGGAALSLRMITGQPIKFIGVGEKIDDLEPFYPERLASSILGQGDILSLIDQVERKIDKEKSEKIVKKIKKGKSFNFNDLKTQLEQVQQMGGLDKIMSKMPGIGNIPKQKLGMQEGMIKRNIAIINSMTKKERRFPKLLDASRKKRISTGSGTQIVEVNRLSKQLNNMKKMMKRFSKGGNFKNMFQNIQNQFPFK